MTSEPTRWYRSKIDGWIAILLALPPIASGLAAFEALRVGKELDVWVAVGAMLFVAGLYGGLIFPMRYGIDSRYLNVRFGLVRTRVELSKINEVKPTRCPLSSPALSLDRLHIRYGSSIFQAVMISPAERERFLADLASTAGLQHVDNRWIRPEQS